MSFVIGFILGAVTVSTFWFFVEHRPEWVSLTTWLSKLFNK